MFRFDLQLLKFFRFFIKYVIMTVVHILCVFDQYVKVFKS